MSDVPARDLVPQGGDESVSQSAPNEENASSLSHAHLARTLLSQAHVATLCTLSPDGFPYGSLVLFAVDDTSGDAILLISDLAEHSRNLRADSRCSLLVADVGSGDSLARSRVTLVGNATVVDNAKGDLLDVFLRKNPSAQQYSSFGDFSVWRILVRSVRFIGGFGRMSWIDIDQWRKGQS